MAMIVQADADISPDDLQRGIVLDWTWDAGRGLFELRRSDGDKTREWYTFLPMGTELRPFVHLHKGGAWTVSADLARRPDSPPPREGGEE